METQVTCHGRFHGGLAIRIRPQGLASVHVKKPDDMEHAPRHRDELPGLGRIIRGRALFPPHHADSHVAGERAPHLKETTNENRLNQPDTAFKCFSIKRPISKQNQLVQAIQQSSIHSLPDIAFDSFSAK